MMSIRKMSVPVILSNHTIFDTQGNKFSTLTVRSAILIKISVLTSGLSTQWTIQKFVLHCNMMYNPKSLCCVHHPTHSPKSPFFSITINKVTFLPAVQVNWRINIIDKYASSFSEGDYYKILYFIPHSSLKFPSDTLSW